MLAAALRHLGYKWCDIGFRRHHLLKGICVGLLFGMAVFAVAYCAEMMIHQAAGAMPSLQYYVTSYTVEGNRLLHRGVSSLFICIVGNIINVIMEEGIFRGLFVRLAEQKYSFITACIVSAVLFGFWHIVGPVRNVVDGVQSPMGALMMGAMLVLTSGLAGIQYTLLYKMTGALWVPMAIHFANNAIVNLFHVITATGTDELQGIRLTITGTISFLLVLIVFLHNRKRLQTALPPLSPV